MVVFVLGRVEAHYVGILDHKRSKNCFVDVIALESFKSLTKVMFELF